MEYNRLKYGEDEAHWYPAELGKRVNERNVNSIQPPFLALQISNSFGRSKKVEKDSVCMRQFRICHAATSKSFTHKKFTSKDLESPNRRTLEDTTRAFCYNKEKRISNLSGLGFGSSRLGLLTLVLRSRGGLLLGLVLLGASLALVAIRRSPQGQIVTQELHDQGAVTVALFGEGVQLSNGIIERLLGEVASTVGRV